MKTFQLPYLLSYYDLLLGPLYFVLIIFFALYWKTKYYKDSPLQRFIIPGLLIKLVGNVILAIIYNFLYPSADMQNYYSGAAEIWNATKENPIYGLELVFKPVEECSAKAQEFASHMAFAHFAPSNRLMFQVSGFIGMFCFGSYIPISMFFTLIGYIGSWRIFKCFCEEFPKHTTLIFAACMLAPSAVMWSNNIQKEPLCILGLGLCVDALYALIKRRFGWHHVLTLSAGAVILLAFKSYILYCFLVAAVAALYVGFLRSSVKPMYKTMLKSFTMLLFVLMCIGVFYYEDVATNLLDKFFTENVEVLQNSQINEGGSTYIIPNVRDFSLPGVIRSYLLSLNVSLFRPYVWEVKNILALLSALEVLFIMLLTLFLLFRTLFKGFFSFAAQSPLLMFSLVFTFLIGPMVGFIAFNFGTLIRYKLPFVPFFYTYLLLLYASNARKKTMSHA